MQISAHLLLFYMTGCEVYRRGDSIEWPRNRVGKVHPPGSIYWYLGMSKRDFWRAGRSALTQRKFLKMEIFHQNREIEWGNQTLTKWKGVTRGFQKYLDRKILTVPTPSTEGFSAAAWVVAPTDAPRALCTALRLLNFFFLFFRTFPRYFLSNKATQFYSLLGNFLGRLSKSIPNRCKKQCANLNCYEK